MNTFQMNEKKTHTHSRQNKLFDVDSEIEILLIKKRTVCYRSLTK